MPAQLTQTADNTNEKSRSDIEPETRFTKRRKRIVQEEDAFALTLKKNNMQAMSAEAIFEE